MSVVEIVPVEIPQSPVIETAVRVIVLSVELGVSATIEAQMMNAVGAVVEVKSLKLEQPDYSYWGSDDQYVINWTLTQLGLSRPTFTPIFTQEVLIDTQAVLIDTQEVLIDEVGNQGSPTYFP